MVLGPRGAIDPRFPWYGRGVMRGTMLARVRVLGVTSADLIDMAVWNPLSSNAHDWAVDTPFAQASLYLGRARVTPNINWRARTGLAEGEVLTDHAVDIEIDFQGNELVDGGGNFLPFPIIKVGSIVLVDSVVAWENVQPTTMITSFTYNVRNTSESSNPWVKSLLCDINMQVSDGN